MATEQERAAQYRVDAQERENARLAREKAMAGSSASYATLLEDWSPLRRWEGWDPIVKVHEEEPEWPCPR